MPIIAIALLIAAALGGGVSVAASNALPGDALYDFKVGVNENIQSALALSDKSQADFDIKAADTRLTEAEKLAAEGKLNADVQAGLSANFAQHSQEVADEVEKLQNKGDFSVAADVAARFQGVLAGHASVLSDSEAHADASSKAALSPIVTAVRGTLGAVSNLSASASAKAEAEDHSGSDVNKNESDASTSNSGSASGEVKASGGLKVNGSTDDSVQTNDDGSVKVNIY